LFTDADFSTPIGEVDKLLHWLENGYQIAIGSRAMPESQIKIYQAWYRQLMGKSFNKFIQLVLNLDYYDTQCGFKCFQRDAALEVFKALKSCRFSFDVEVLYIAKHLGLKVKEVPICWYNSAGSKVRLIRDSSKMFLDVLQIRFGHVKPGK
jgi:dolichyl-phosphate beta-glucosyltransferase